MIEKMLGNEAEKPLVYTVKRMAVALQIGKNAAYDLVNSGSIPVFTVGQKKLVPKVGLQRWIEKQGQNHKEG